MAVVEHMAFVPPLLPFLPPCTFPCPSRHPPDFLSSQCPQSPCLATPRPRPSHPAWFQAPGTLLSKFITQQVKSHFNSATGCILCSKQLFPLSPKTFPTSQQDFIQLCMDMMHELTTPTPFCHEPSICLNVALGNGMGTINASSL